MFKSTAALVFLLGAVCSQPARHDDRPAPASVIDQRFYIFGPPPKELQPAVAPGGARGAFAPPPGPPPGPKPTDSSCSDLTDMNYPCKDYIHFCGLDSDNGKLIAEACPKTCCKNKEDSSRCNKPADKQAYCKEYRGTKYCKTNDIVKKNCPTSCGCPSSGAGESAFAPPPGPGPKPPGPKPPGPKPPGPKPPGPKPPGPKPPGPKPPGPKPPGPKPPGPASCDGLKDEEDRNCKDSIHYCGINSGNGQLMEEYCPKTCCENREDLSRCNQPADTQAYCKEYRGTSYCKNYKYIQEDCPTSCGCY